MFAATGQEARGVTDGRVSEAATPAAQAAVAQDRAARRRIELLLRVRELGIVLAIAVLVFVTALYNPRFLSGCRASATSC